MGGVEADRGVFVMARASSESFGIAGVLAAVLVGAGVLLLPPTPIGDLLVVVASVGLAAVKSVVWWEGM